ncbi:MAG: transglycosylase SLT domain-containing protein [Sporomusaceae bacterium]|nr:transglycosylase SLT domain-containing protein [Sporomusaceae bacterium]
MAEISIRITADNKQAITAIKELVQSGQQIRSVGDQADNVGEKISAIGSSNSFSGLKSSGEGFLGTLSKIGMSIYGVVESLRLLKETAETVFGVGLKYDQQMETSRMAIAGILKSMTTWNGQEMSLNQAMELSSRTLSEIEQKAVSIGLVPQELMAGFQSILGPGLQAKMTLAEIVSLTTMGTKAVKAMLGAQADEMQISQELRSIVSGNIDQDSTVAKALGITNSDVQQAKQSAGGLFSYLEEKLGGFKELAEKEWPNSMTGVIDKFKAQYSQASGSASESIFEAIKDEVKDLNDYLFVTDEQTKKVSFNPDLLDKIKLVVQYTIKFGEGVVETGSHLAQLTSGPLSLVLGLSSNLFDSSQQILLTFIAWKVIEEIRPILANLRREAGLNLVVFKALVETSGVFKATLITTGTVMKGLLVTTGWGLLAVAIGHAADQAFRLYDNLFKSNKEKKDYFKEKEAANAPIPQQLEGKLQAPQYDVNPDVNMGGMHQDAILKMEKFISAINYMFPDKHVTLTSGYRGWGGHTSGTKADIVVDGMEDPFFRQQLIKLAKDFGITVIDEVEKRASDSPEAIANYAPHLDIDMGSKASDGNLGLKNEPSTYDIQSKKVELVIQQIKNQAETDKKAAQVELDQLNLQIKAGTMGIDADLKVAELELRKKQIDLDAMTAQKAAYNTLYGADTDGSHKDDIAKKILEINTTPLQNEINIATESLKHMGVVLGLTNKSWRDNAEQIDNFTNAIVGIESHGDYNALGPVIDGDRALGKYQIMQSNWGSWAAAAGLGKDADWHVPENQDAVAKHQFMELFAKYQDWLKVAIAWHAGEGHVNDTDAQLSRLSDGNMTTLEYKNQVASFMSNNAAQWQKQIPQYVPNITNSLSSLFEKIQNLMSKMAEIDSMKAELQGDTRPQAYASIDSKYEPYMKLFKANGQKEYLDKTYQLVQIEKNRADFTPVTQKIDKINKYIVSSETELLESVYAGTRDPLLAIKEYTNIYTTTTNSSLEQLKKQLNQALYLGDTTQAVKIKEAIQGLQTAIDDFYDKTIKQIDASAQFKVSMINANPKTTDLEKSNAVESVQKQQYLDTAKVQLAEAERLTNLTKEQKASYETITGKSADFTAEVLRNSATLNEALGKTHSYIEDLSNAARQGLKDGFLNFFEEGIFKVHKFSDVFKDLITSMLQEMNKITAKRLTSQMMASINLDFAQENADGGHIQGPGTGTSDSILSWLSNGEFVIKAASVKRYGTAFFHALNNGFLPPSLLPRFATGGQVGGNAVEGAAGLVASISTGGTSVPLTIVNVDDPNKMERFFGTSRGSKVIMNWMKGNAPTVRQLLNIKG